jgi:hypothetical protein
MLEHLKQDPFVRKNPCSQLRHREEVAQKRQPGIRVRQLTQVELTNKLLLSQEVQTEAEEQI